MEAKTQGHYPELPPLSLATHPIVAPPPNTAFSSYHQPELMQEGKLLSLVLPPSHLWSTLIQKGSFQNRNRSLSLAFFKTQSS